MIDARAEPHFAIALPLTVARDPAVTAGEGHMIQAGAMLVESVTCVLGWVCKPNSCPPHSANTVW